MTNSKDVESQKLLEAFCTSDPVGTETVRALRLNEQIINPKARAILHLYEAAFGNYSVRDALQEAEKAASTPSTLDFHLLFLLAWIRALMYHDIEPEQLKLVVKRASSLVNDDTPPELKAWIAFGRLYLEDRNGNSSYIWENLDQMIDPVPSSSVHYRRLLQCRDMFLYSYGMGAALEPVDFFPEAQQGDLLAQRLAIFRLMNDALIGSVEDATPLMHIVQKYSWDAKAPCLEAYEVACFTLQLMYEERGRDEPWFKELAKELRHTSEPGWVHSTRALLRHQPDQALSWARQSITSESTHQRIRKGFDAYVLIRAELCMANAAAARRFIEQRRSLGSEHYLDDLFLCRIELLAGNENLASRHFRALLRSVDTYHASGRLNFELRLAHELSPTALMRLSELARDETGGSEKRTRRRTPQAEDAPAASVDSIDVSGVQRLVHSSAAMANVCELIIRFSRADEPVLITGETGTGKEVVTQALHEESLRRGEPFVAINCGAICDALIESELFGHQRGAFTGATVSYRGLFREAGAGTIFLDEIGEISSRLQVALLRVLETNEVRSIGSSVRHPITCRIVAATNVDLDQRVQQGLFRQDLLYRLKRLVIHITPLRDRSADILPLIRHFLNHGRPAGVQAAMAPELEAFLTSYEWPGNVRELRNTVELMRLMHSDKLHYELPDISSGSLKTISDSGLGTAVEVSEAVPPSAGHAAEEGFPKSFSGTKHPRPARSKRRRLQQLELLFREYPELKVYEVAELLSVSRHTASRYLKELCRGGVIKQICPTDSTSTNYFVILDEALHPKQ